VLSIDRLRNALTFFFLVSVLSSSGQLLNDPSNEEPSEAFNYHPNFGQIIDTSGNQIASLKYYNRNHVPATYFHSGFVSCVYHRPAFESSELDTFYRLDLVPIVETATLQ
jgi:hypothetical protein